MLNKKPSIVKRQGTIKKLLVEELTKAPIVEIACRKAGVSRATFYRWCKDDPTFSTQTAESLTDGKLIINDLAESQLISAIKNQNLGAIIFWLKSNHPAYRNRLELSTFKPKEELTPEQQKIVRQTLQLTNLDEESI